MFTSRTRRVALFGLLALALTAPVFAQATGAITGLITDQSGAVMPGVTVEATNTATGQVRNGVTGSDGFYTLPLLQPGRYNVKATLTGFKPVVREAAQVYARRGLLAA